MGDVALLAATVVRVWQRLHWLYRKVGRTAPSHRPTLLRVTPWVVAGAVVSQVAWAREVRAAVRAVDLAEVEA